MHSPLPSILYSSERSLYVQSTPKKQGVMLWLLASGVSIEIICNSNGMGAWPLFLCFFIYLYPNGILYIHFILWITTQCHTIALLKLTRFGHQELFHLVPVLLWHTSINEGFVFCFSISLLSGAIRYSGLIFISPIHISQKHWFLLLEKDIRNWGLGKGLVDDGVFASFRPSQLTEHKNMCVF